MKPYEQMNYVLYSIKYLDHDIRDEQFHDVTEAFFARLEFMMLREFVQLKLGLAQHAW